MTLGDPKLPQRFWDKVIPVPWTGCWLWLGATDRKGYSKFWYKGKARRAYRLVKRFRRTAHHKCFQPGCVNPTHLVDVSRAKNSKLGHNPFW